MTGATYYRGPDEPGGSGEIIAEVVDGKLRRRIERDGQSVRCIGYDQYPVEIDMEMVADFVWTIDRTEFESEWRRYCGSLDMGQRLAQGVKAHGAEAECLSVKVLQAEGSPGPGHRIRPGL